MKIRFLPAAERDLADIRAYIAQDSPRAAINIINRIAERTASLAEFPNQGTSEGKYRQLAISGTPYLVTYRVAGQEVRILRVLHGRQRRP